MTTSNGKPLTKCRGGGGCAHKRKKHYDDSKRRNQAGRFAKLELQVPMSEAAILRQKILDQNTLLSSELRPRVPSTKSIAFVLGVFKTGGSLSQDAIRSIELSVQEIARLAGVAKTICNEVLAWLGDGFVTRRGQPVARGLGLIQSESRKGISEQCGHKRVVKRTSVRSLTALGRDFVGLVTVPKKQDGTSFNREAMRAERRKRKVEARERALSAMKTVVFEFHKLDVNTGARAETINDVPATEAPEEYSTEYFIEVARRVTSKPPGWFTA